MDISKEPMVLSIADCKGPSDYLAVNTLQDTIEFTKLSDWSQIERMKQIGFVVGQSYDLSKQSMDIQNAVAQGAKAGLANMYTKLPTLAPVFNGWQMNTTTTGVYVNLLSAWLI